MKNVACLVLGGGKGTRLQPLTAGRSKPAVPLAGKYRIVDIPISNCLNSGMSRIYLLTQFESVSLHRHIRQTYRFDPFNGGFVEILAAQQTAGPGGDDWYQGTADAVRKNLRFLKQYGIDYVLILSGDQLYQMDFRDMVRTHQQTKADVTIAALPIDDSQAHAFGVMRLDQTGRIGGFLEKPQTEDELSAFRTDPKWIDAQGIESRGRECLASMGIYLFNRNTLVDLLEKTNYADFGKEVFPAAIRSRKVFVHLFDGFWEDIGTIRAFYETNLALAQRDPPFRFDLEDYPVYTRPRYLPPTRIDGATILGSLVADGCNIEQGTVIENSLIGLRCNIGRDVTIKNCVVMGADYYETADHQTENRRLNRPPLGIGDGSVIEGAILDKNCRIGKGVTIRPNGEEEADHGPVVIRDGILVVPREAILQDNWSL
jgi:glucose-1-phosphate adenylyltransferase